MKKLGSYPLFLALSLLAGGLCYLILENLFMASAVALIYLIVLFFLVATQIKEYQTKGRKRRECYRFVNAFVIAHSSNQSLEQSFAAAIEGAGPELLEVVGGLSNQEIRGRVFYLANYFESDLYGMFLSEYALYEEQGGDLLSLYKGLLDEFTHVEEFQQAREKESLRNLLEYGSLWGMSVLILAFLRVGLNNFYGLLTKSQVYIMSVLFYFVFLLAAICLYARFYTGVKIRFPFKRREK